MAKITFDFNDIWKGVSKTDFLPTGGFSPEDKGQNLYVKKGLIYPQPLEGDPEQAQQIVAGWAFNNDTNPDLCSVNANEGSGYVQEYDNDGDPVLKQTASVKTYGVYYTDMVNYDGNFYITSTIDVNKLPVGLGSQDEDWWSDTMVMGPLTTNVAHQLLVYNKILYIADDNDLRSYDGTTAVASALDLPSDDKICSIVEWNNKIYINTEKHFNPDGSQNMATAKMYSWDGEQPTWIDEFGVPEKFFTMFNYNGHLLCFGAYTLYEYNGVNFKPLWDLDVSSPVYKQKVFQHKDRLYFANGRNIICFDGERFSYFFNTENAGGLLEDKDVAGIAFMEKITTEMMIVSAGARSFVVPLMNNDGATANTGTGYGRINRHNFYENVRVRKVYVELGEDLVTDSSMTISYFNEDGDEITIGTMTFTDDGAVRKKTFRNINSFATSVQPRWRWQVNGKPIKSITFFVEKTEHPIE